MPWAQDTLRRHAAREALAAISDLAGTARPRLVPARAAIWSGAEEKPAPATNSRRAAPQGKTTPVAIVALTALYPCKTTRVAERRAMAAIPTNQQSDGERMPARSQRKTPPARRRRPCPAPPRSTATRRTPGRGRDLSKGSATVVRVHPPVWPSPGTPRPSRSVKKSVKLRAWELALAHDCRSRASGLAWIPA